MVGRGGTSSLETAEFRLKAVFISPLGTFCIDVLKLVLWRESVVCFRLELVSMVVLWSVTLFLTGRTFLVLLIF